MDGHVPRAQLEGAFKPLVRKRTTEETRAGEEQEPPLGYFMMARDRVFHGLNSESSLTLFNNPNYVL